jgi:hypothetical protein
MFCQTRWWETAVSMFQPRGKKLLNRGIVKCRGQNEKIGVDWPRPEVFRKNCQSVRCRNRKIGVDWPRPKAFRKKSSMFRLVSLDAGFVDQNLASTRWVFCQNFLEPGDRQSVLHFDGLPLTRGAVVATPFADAFSLTFRPVKSTDALAS